MSSTDDDSGLGGNQGESESADPGKPDQVQDANWQAVEGQSGGTGEYSADYDASKTPDANWQAVEAGAGGTGESTADYAPTTAASGWRDNAPPRTFGAPTDAPGLALYFRVTLEVVDLGFWTKVSGLGVSIHTEDRGEAAMNFFQHHLPNHLKYDNIVLERPVSADTATVMNWLSAYHMLPIPTTGEVACVDQSGKVLMSWEMFGVTPVSWKGPNFDANATNVATEVLTLAHMGFL